MRADQIRIIIAKLLNRSNLRINLRSNLRSNIRSNLSSNLALFVPPLAFLFLPCFFFLCFFYWAHIFKFLLPLLRIIGLLLADGILIFFLLFILVVWTRFFVLGESSQAHFTIYPSIIHQSSITEFIRTFLEWFFT